MASGPMRIITGDETGLVKLVDVTASQCSTWGEQSRALGVKGMAWIVQNEEFFLVRANAALEYYMIQGGALVLKDSVSLEGMLGEGDNIQGLASSQDGSVAVFATSGAIASYERGDGGKIKEVGEVVPVRGPLSAVCLSGAMLAAGGNENDVQVWDRATRQMAWAGKNVPNDFLSLRIPIWITGLSFMRTNDTYSEHELVAGTGHKHVRLYDVRAKRAPVVTMDIGDFRVTSIAPHIDGRSVNLIIIII
jgi:WD40 repeat protein